MKEKSSRVGGKGEEDPGGAGTGSRVARFLRISAVSCGLPMIFMAWSREGAGDIEPGGGIGGLLSWRTRFLRKSAESCGLPMISS
jgi:hypothetical protein